VSVEVRGSEAFTVGIEEELLLVDPQSHFLAPDAVRVLEAIHAPEGAAGHEIYRAQIELRSPPARTTMEAVDAVASLRAKAAEAGALLLGAGVHPAGALGDAPLVETDRYRHVAEAMRGLIRRTPESALHVHVGMPDVDAAVRALNGLRAQLPLLQALAANSPFWFGRDSGLASARAALVRAYPGRGIPPRLRDAADWRQTAEMSLAAAGVDDPTLLWWDVRVHPRYGTVEVRELDAQSSPAAVGALAALVRALAAEAASSASPASDVSSETLAWSAFRAIRDGVSGSILHDGALRPVADVAREAVERLRPIAGELGDADALELVQQLLAHGGGAARQRTAFTAGGMPGLLRFLVEETTGKAMTASGAERADSTCGVVQQWLEARAHCDLERLAALTAEDAVWRSPVHGELRGRRAVLEQIREAFTDTQEFATELLALECRPAKAIALIRNTGYRDGEHLDSVQQLFIDLRTALVARVAVVVDDPEAVQAFWDS
jgi:carboxylate-amine ligase